MRTKDALARIPVFLLRLCIISVLLLGLSGPRQVQAAENLLTPEEASISGQFQPETLSAGSSYSCAIKADGTLACWGDTSVIEDPSIPEGAFTQISLYDWNACGLRSDGTLVCWAGVYGDTLTAPPGIFIQVTTGYNHACGIKEDGTLACWGIPSTPANRIAAPSGVFTQIDAGEYHTCGVRSVDNRLICWGDYVLDIANPYIQFSSGLGNVCGVTSNGTPECHGETTYGKSSPLDGTYTRISADTYHTCGVKTDGTIACWGYNENGSTVAPAGTFTQVAAGYTHTCGLKTDGTVLCWGNGSATYNQAPTGDFGQQRVSAGDDFTCAIKSNGGLIC